MMTKQSLLGHNPAAAALKAIFPGSHDSERSGSSDDPLR